MSITVAKPHELLLISEYLKNALGDINLKLLRKLSFCLAQERGYVLKEGETLCGAMLIDRDFLGADRVVVLVATDDQKRHDLLLKARQEARSSAVYMVLPAGDALSPVLVGAGFQLTGSFSCGVFSATPSTAKPSIAASSSGKDLEEDTKRELPLIVGSSLAVEGDRPHKYEIYLAPARV